MKDKTIKQTINILEIQAQDSIMVIREKTITRFMSLREVTYICSSGYLSTVHTIGGGCYTVSKLLIQFESCLLKYGFIRINRNAIVNIVHVEQYIPGGNPTIKLHGNRLFSVSRRRTAIINGLFILEPHTL